MMILVSLVAILLRFYNLGVTPAGLHVDEASIGYNAYSILETGRDEYGKSFPLLIRSFGDYKAPVYTYLLVPVYKIWGMNMMTTRSVSAAAGVITVLFLYWLIKLVTDKQRLAVLSSLVLAISPWHILLSRAAVEANVALMLMIVGLWAFFKYLKGAKVFLMVAIAVTVVSLTAYHSQRLILPLLYLGLGWQYRTKIFKRRDLKWLVGGLIVGLMLLTPTLLVLRTPAFFARAERVNVLGIKTEQLWGFVEKAGALNNRALLFIREWLSLYTAYFSPRYLFGLGNYVLRNIYPDVGALLIWQLPFLIIGVVSLIRLKRSGWKTLLILLLVISPLPASLVREPFGVIRALPMVIPISILVAMGMEVLVEKRKFWATMVIVGLVFWGLGRIYFSAFRLNDYYHYQYWDDGTDQVVEEINKLEDPKIQVDNWRSEIYSQLAFFLKYDPAKYQADNGMKDLDNYYNNGAIGQIKRMGRVTVKSINWNEDLSEEKVLVGSSIIMGDDLIEQYGLTKVFTIRAPDNEILFIGARTNPEKAR
jgi:4-amino-4-deoxy-L-arabinose transferase-like glycosyltransferase